jgi:hypothetical protein
MRFHDAMSRRVLASGVTTGDGGPINIHLHGTRDEESSTEPSRSSGTEPAINNGAAGSIEDRLQTLELAIAMLVQNQGGESDNGDQPEADPDPDPDQSEAGNEPDVSQQQATQEVNSTDELPDIAHINETNKAFWANTTSQSVTGMGDVPANSREGQPGRSDNNLDIGRRLSTASGADLGSTSANSIKNVGRMTSDARRGQIYKQQTAKANRLVNSINARNQRFYGRSA